VLLLNAMLEQRLPQAELARRMGTRKQEVQRLVDLRHPTKIDTLAQAMAAMGKQLVLSASAIPGRAP
jgi:antitoxin HicB